ncbi:uncharacterized protein EDB93DRAFT_1245767 [Suillus bovinus]|uniref:uncharacterized protein n=1 Tax=Suillus bovinus TaxID=48563 RepID=UPI001B88056C|nr:uncharacterized protein EDB93DRAFT_1245767 [Suillus bovinus]KAG2158537.1 hypothetical protein EDB93DRAFT_1245767 [Suillus bovinus]
MVDALSSTGLSILPSTGCILSSASSILSSSCSIVTHSQNHLNRLQPHSTRSLSIALKTVVGLRKLPISLKTVLLAVVASNQTLFAQYSLAQDSISFQYLSRPSYSAFMVAFKSASISGSTTMSIPVFKPFMCNGDRYLTATDAFCVATYGHRVITTTNMKFIPQSFDNESDIIQARADGRYWAIDPFQWPQMYNDLYARSFAIPHQEAYMDDSSMTYAWFRPAFTSDFVPLAPDNLVGQLKTDILDHLK